MLSAATSCARAAISGVENVPSQMRDFLRGSRISDTHLPQLRIRTPRYTGCLLHSLGLLPDLRSGDLEAELDEKGEDVDSEILFASAINVAAEEKEGDHERGFCREGQGRTTMHSGDAPMERPSNQLTIDNKLFLLYIHPSIHLQRDVGNWRQCVGSTEEGFIAGRVGPTCSYLLYQQRSIK